jgi:polysaccharide biosynthesis protein PslG
MPPEGPLNASDERWAALRRGSARVGALCAVLLCLVPSAVAGAPASPAPASYYGANIQPLIKLGIVAPSGWNGLIAGMSADGLQTARMDAIWSWAEPNPPVSGKHTYVWSSSNPANSLDALVAMLASNRVRMLAVLSTPPGWAAAQGTQLAPSHYGDFVAFAAAFAARYGAGGTFWAANPQLPYLPVEQFEVWTEANSSNFWTATPSPAEYLKVLAPLTAAVHAVDPTGQVLASIGWQNFQTYVTQLYQLGAKGSFDGIGFHPYAPDTPGILLLTEQLRATLESVGDPALPIYLTETGQPVVTSGPGATFAYNGPVSDAARAATLSLAGDALAHSDCNVQSFDVYALIGSGTNREPAGEGFMGIFDYTTGAPNLTGAAIGAASLRWQASPATGLVLCGNTATPAGALLPLGLTLTHTSPTCVSAEVTYHGNPIEAAELVLRTADGRVDPAGTDAFGQTQMCLQDGPAITSFTVSAELSSPLTSAALTAPNVAQSATYACPVTSAACTPGTLQSTAGGPAEGGGPSNPPAAPTRCRLGASIVRVARTRTTVRARLRCTSGTAAAVRLAVSLERRGKRTRSRIAIVILTGARWRTFALRVHLRPGDRVIVSVPDSKALRLTAPATARRAPARRRHGTNAHL